MPVERFPAACEVSQADILYQRPLVERTRQRAGVRQEDAADPWSYGMKLGRATIWLTAVEYRIFSLLASRPYRAFSRRRIAEAVSTHGQPIAPEAVAMHVAALRGKLGFFADYIQSVPYVGYRFKA